ncbi:MAG TPA: hypothetical protein VN408_08695 [Actinoplanes sp.]|nr:hypothetical protein [Actinoplanes sp.]
MTGVHIEFRRDAPLPGTRPAWSPIVVPTTVLGTAGTAIGLRLNAPAAVTVTAAIAVVAGLAALGHERRFPLPATGPRTRSLPETWIVTDESISLHTAESRYRWSWNLIRSATVHPDRYRLELESPHRLDLPRPEIPQADAEIDAHLRNRGLLPPLSGGLPPWRRS